MKKRGVAIAAGLVLAAAGVVGLSHWNGARLRDCEWRGAQFETLDVLKLQPGTFQGGEAYAGCDVDRLVAYAGRQFVPSTGASGDQLVNHTRTTIDEPSVIAYYRSALTTAGWELTKPPPSGASLCARTNLSGGTVYANLSFTDAATYDLMVATSLDSGAPCE
jgi:hypothetical protein